MSTITTVKTEPKKRGKTEKSKKRGNTEKSKKHETRGKAGGASRLFSDGNGKGQTAAKDNHKAIGIDRVTAHGQGKTFVGESAIHGLGLFAKEVIRKGMIVGRIEGTLSRQDGPHVLWIHDAYGIEVSNDMRYINHSDDANACYYDDATVVAIRRILPGEEITHNYDGD